MNLPPSLTVWDDIVSALVRADELTDYRPQAGFTARSLRLVRAEESAAVVSRQPVAFGDRQGKPLLHP